MTRKIKALLREWKDPENYPTENQYETGKRHAEQLEEWRDDILAYRRDLKEMQDDLPEDRHGMRCEIAGRIKALEWVLGHTQRCPRCNDGILSAFYEAGSEHPVEYLCDRCGEKIDGRWIHE